MCDVCGKNLYVLCACDAETIACQMGLTRKLTDEELSQIQKGLEFGLECWSEVMRTAIKEALKKVE